MTDGVSASTVEFDGVSHGYGERRVLHDISAILRERRIGIVGANGSGKSTLVRMINGLVAPDVGTVRVNGVNVIGRQRRRVRRGVGFIFSDPDRQVIMPTVVEDIELSLSRSPATKEERSVIVAKALARFGLDGHADHPSHLLSGGQKQLLALASVLVTEPRIIVADEPTTLLDLRNTRMLSEVFAGLDEQLIVISHDLDILTDFDRVLVLDEGRLVCDDVPAPALDYYRKLMS
ncbi:putative ABC transporter ATP-binding protein [Gordonia effusa NBRC 100432]|uniref:Putative ABC transporter ATP-binding protein n=1 Tax=Gordonia effusa NBRC 100432 TaxID=1077974 RepID=H0R272_9ACTN|nr:ABC transporter ATP-binding protein [Gordonia effusa]GAB19173.1 putative ABC transporter ATP-binding protein [Gordonia effusa NBRC 100432]